MTDKFQDKQVQNIIFNQLSKDKYYELLKEGKIVENEFYITNDSFKDNAGGLDVLDIGQSLYVDESQGLRRYLNGSWVDINRNTQLFYERLMKAASLNPELICTEDEWNALEKASPFGQVGKFVVDTINGRVRLPKVVYVCGTLDLGKLGELDSQRFLVAEQKGATWYRWYSDGWLEQGGVTGAISNTNTTITFPKAFANTNYSISAIALNDRAYAYADKFPSVRSFSATQLVLALRYISGNQALAIKWRTEGYGAVPTKANYNLGNATGKVNTQYPYYIQIATGLETVLNISDQIQVNNPYTLGESKYSPIQLNNASWLHYSIKNNPRSLYPAYYDMLLRIYQGKETIDGITVKHVSDTTATRYDHTIDPANQTFNLPSLNGSEDMPINTNNPEEAFSQVLDYKDKITVSGVKITAPYNGWLRISWAYEENKYVYLHNETTQQCSIQSPASSGTFTYAHIFCKAGDIIRVDYTSTVAINKCHFYIASKPGHLYYYVGETNKNADLTNTGKMADLMQRHIDGDLAYYVEYSWVSGLNFCRKYSDGWMEQGGRATSGSGSFTTVNLHQPFINTNYNITVSVYNTGDNNNNYNVKINAPTKTSFAVRGAVGNNAASAPAYWWHACGYWK